MISVFYVLFPSTNHLQDEFLNNLDFLSRLCDIMSSDYVIIVESDFNVDIPNGYLKWKTQDFRTLSLRKIPIGSSFVKKLERSNVNFKKQRYNSNFYHGLYCNF